MREFSIHSVRSNNNTLRSVVDKKLLILIIKSDIGIWSTAGGAHRVYMVRCLRTGKGGSLKRQILIRLRRSGESLFDKQGSV